MVKILAIGDPHGDIKKIKKISIKDIDLILLTGDLGSVNIARKLYFDNIKRIQNGLDELKRTSKQERDIQMEIYNSTLKILKYLSKFAPVYTIEGNVLISKPSDVRNINKKYNLKIPSTKIAIEKIKNVQLIKNRVRIINGLKIGFLEYFTDICWINEFKPIDYKIMIKSAKKETEKAKGILRKFGNIDILVCHQPPYGILDKVSSRYNPPKNWIGKHAGSKVILDYIKKYKPKYVFCGHIHEAEGFKKIEKTEVYNLGVTGHKTIETN